MEKFDKELKKLNRKVRMFRNRMQGKLGETDTANELIAKGWKVERKPFGQDFIATKGRKKRWIEVKTGKSKTSPLQRKIKKKVGDYRYKVVRSPWDF